MVSRCVSRIARSDDPKQAEGTAIPCYTTALLEETQGADDEGVLGTAALIYSGGLDTVSNFPVDLSSLLMPLFRQCQQS
jgi:hypothetical protein